MLYKTMVLHLLEARPAMYEELRQARTLLLTMERLAGELKASHEEQKALLSQAWLSSDPSQIASQALEIALQELEVYLDSESPPDESDPSFLADAMAYLRKRTPPA